MGNTPLSNSNNSNEKTFQNMYDVIDYIATYYILTMDFKSLSKLTEKEYCDNLLILTTDIFERYLNDTEITYLAQRIKNGEEINLMTKDNLKFINKNELDDLSVKNDSIQKKRMCVGIAKFYIKIAHIFASIVMTINPVYMYKDEYGNTVKRSLLEKDTIPKNVDRKLYKLNICDDRIRALKKGESYDETTGKVNLQPKMCDFNLNSDGQPKNLEDEPGIVELMKLYLDDNYDYATGIFTGMSESTKLQFNKDLKTFYKAFTGNDVMPDSITKFSDIKLRDFNSKCKESIFKQKQTISKSDELFVKYAENIQNMIKSAANNQGKLLTVVNDIFTYVNDPNTGKRKIRINPKLNEESLQNIVEITRKTIIDLYVKCETDYLNGIKLYEAIVETQILKSTENQIESLKKDAKKISDEIRNDLTQKNVMYDQIPPPKIPSANVVYNNPNI